MKIFVAFLFVHLIAGILCSEADKPKNTRNTEMLLELYMLMLRALRLYRLDDLGEAVKQAVIDKCKKNGGPKAFDDAKESLLSLQNSIDSLINDTANQVLLVGSESWNAQEQIPRFCDKYMTVLNQTKPPLTSVRPCLDEAERASANIAYNMMFVGGDFFCRNNGSNLISFYTARGFECIISHYPRNCSVQMPPRNNSTVLTDGVRIAGAPWYYETSYPSLNECKSIRTAKICAVEKLSGCEQPEPASVVNSGYAAVEKAAGCENILNAEASSAA
ncbi:27 kDa glycoprotein-like isoform X7 [Neodiprion virginianus]|uniref:27 kDa glycoprotein-like isoform X6 n=1 Tax=Neodiprion virginianus TaxID=2961670 RepID=UPI001EE6C2B2|nr:27 kDa glycoprotein-like isoform X6 [Neodiprion virginianus]XP_046617338.1 27 kDa glycoprotein-like isoform X7 [Neodiprion virginianus]